MQSSLIQHEYLLTMGAKKPKGKVFQTFGFDILIDEKYKAWILEINDHPSFNIMFSKEFMGTKKEDEILSNVDLYTKSEVIREAIGLALSSQTKLAEIGDRVLHNTRVLPSRD